MRSSNPTSAGPQVGRGLRTRRSTQMRHARRACRASARPAAAPYLGTTVQPNRAIAGFTLAEVLAALLFVAIVVPVAIAALQTASLSGEVAERKAAAARIADRVLSESAVATGALALPPDGTTVENGRPFRWTLQRETWPVSLTSTSTLQVLTAKVAFSAQGRDYDVCLSTLVNEP